MPKKVCREGISACIETVDGSRRSAGAHSIHHENHVGVRPSSHQLRTIASVHEDGSFLRQKSPQSPGGHEAQSIITTIFIADSDNHCSRSRIDFHARTGAFRTGGDPPNQT